MSTTEALDREIRSLVTELMQSVPLAPSWVELERREEGLAPSRNRRAPWTNRQPRRWALSVAAACAMTILLVVLLLPTPALPPPTAAAAVLRHLARQAAAAEPEPSLKDDQWLQSQFHISYLAVPTYGGLQSDASRNARAVITVNAEDWANDLSQYCSQQVVTSVVYDSPASQRVWSSNSGLSSAPQSQCGSGFLDADGRASGRFDLTRLPTEPAALARVIDTGTTGLSALDQPLPGGGHLTPFGRAVLLLVGPTSGGTPALWSALLRAMSTMPGVALLGTETTHGGGTGVALAGATGEGFRTTVILSPGTGALLEARNLLVGQFLAGLPFGVLTIRWIDPTGSPQAVDTSMLPSSLAGQVPTGIVSALTNPGVTLNRWNAWLSSVLPDLAGDPSAGAGVTSAPGIYGVSVITHSPDPDIARIVRLFQGSGLVHGVRSALG